MRSTSPLLTLAALGLPLLASACWFRTKADVEHDYAETLRPKQLETAAAPVPTAALRDVLLRVYVDDAYRDRTLHWRPKLDTEFEHINAYVGPRFHIRFVLDVRPWSRKSTGTDLSSALTELAELEPATDCDWVLGLTGVLPRVTSVLHEIGWSLRPSRYMVARAMDDLAEAQAIEETFADLPAEERVKLYRERRDHKEIVVFLHEWAHTLGAVHTRNPDDLLYPSYDHHQQSFGEPNGSLLDAALEERLTRRGKPVGTQAALDIIRKHLLDHTCPACDQSDFAELSSVINAGDAEIAEKQAAMDRAAKESGEAELTPAEVDTFNAARLMAIDGKLTEAWAKLEPLLAKHPTERHVVPLACSVGATPAVAAPKAVEYCKAWAAAEPGQSVPLIALAHVALRTGQGPDAEAAVVEAEKRLSQRKPDDVEGWHDFATLAQQMGTVSRVERALEHLPASETTNVLREWCRQTRRRTGLPPSAEKYAISPGREADYVRTVESVFQKLSRHLPKVANEIDAGLKQYPGAPGLLAARCELLTARGDRTGGRKACKAAIAAYDETVWAHFDLALIQLDARELGPARNELERVIQLEPSVKNAWRNLAEIHRVQKDHAALEVLRARYQKQFGAPLN